MLKLLNPIFHKPNTDQETGLKGHVDDVEKANHFSKSYCSIKSYSKPSNQGRY